MTERWRAEAKKVVLEVHDAMQWQDEQGAVEALLELIELVQRETRQSIAAALADRVDILRGGDEDAVYAHAVSIALTEGAGAESPSGERGECPCGFGDEPWHWPRGGVCVVGMQSKVGERQDTDS